MRPLLSIMFVAMLAACSPSAPSSHTRVVDKAQAKQLLLDRNWLDRMPDTDRDRLFVYRFVPSMGGGVFQDRTLFKGTFELFSFESTGDEIKFVLHETKTNVTTPYTIETVDGPAPFDLKLTIPDDPRGPKIYFGIRSETDRDGSQLQQRWLKRVH